MTVTSPVTWTRTTTTVPSGRLGTSGAYSPLNKGMLLFGGLNTSGVLDEAWIFTSDGWSQLTALASPSARMNAALSQCDENGTILLFGGFGWANAQGSTYPLADTWLFDGTGFGPQCQQADPRREFPHALRTILIAKCSVYSGENSLLQTVR